jgi:multiple sugar transport system permease protein
LSIRSIILYTALAAVAAVMIGPFLWMLLTSLQSTFQALQFPPQWIPQPAIWQNYLHAWQRVPLGRYYVNSMVIAGAITAGQVTTSVLAAYVFARMEFPGRDIIFLLYLGTLIIPTQVTLVPTFLVVRWLGWVDTYQAVIAPSLAHPFGVFLLRQFFLSIPDEVEDAARIDGASSLGILVRIILPISMPAIAALAVFSFMWAWNSFLWPLIVLQSPDKYTLPVGLAMLQSELSTDWPVVMAATVVATLPVVALFLLAQKQFARGIALTGMKV